jgi:D-galactarolactone isomerase
LQPPAHACDSGIHIYDPAFPTVPGTRVVAGATVDAYRAVQSRLGLSRTVIVQPSAYGTDNSCTLKAVAAFGSDARGIAVLGAGVTDAELEHLHAGGIRGVRYQFMPGSTMSWDDLAPLASRVAALGWHVQVQMDGRVLDEREALLKNLPCPLVIDHIGKFLEPVSVDHSGFQTILRLLDTGNCWLKLAAAYEVSRSGAPLYEDVGALAIEAVRAAPERMIWASNWPHVATSQPPEDADLLDLLLHWASDDTTRKQILADNPAKLFGFDDEQGTRLPT